MPCYSASPAYGQIYSFLHPLTTDSARPTWSYQFTYRNTSDLPKLLTVTSVNRTLKKLSFLECILTSLINTESVLVFCREAMTFTTFNPEMKG